VNEISDPDGGQTGETSARPRRSRLLVILVALLFIECLLVTAAAVYLLIELLIDTPVSYPAAIAILVLTVVAAAWVGMIAIHTLRGRPWTRGAAVVWQVLQGSIGLGALQGLFARPDVGWPLIILSLVVLVLLFTKPVLDATARGDDELAE
jgi:hypothetical protein